MPLVVIVNALVQHYFRPLLIQHASFLNVSVTRRFSFQQVATDTNDRPVEDVRIIRAYLR